MKRTFGLFAMVASLFFLNGCTIQGGSSNSQAPTRTAENVTSGSFYFKTPTAKNQEAALSIGVTRIFNSGPQAGFPLSVSIRVSRSYRTITNRVTELSPLNARLAQTVAASTFENPVDLSQVSQLGRQIASQTACQGLDITRNTYGSRISNPEAISQFLAATGGRVFGQRLPDNIPTEELPEVTPDSRPQVQGWSVNLWCR